MPESLPTPVIDLAAVLRLDTGKIWDEDNISVRVTKQAYDDGVSVLIGKGQSERGGILIDNEGRIMQGNDETIALLRSVLSIAKSDPAVDRKVRPVRGVREYFRKLFR